MARSRNIKPGFFLNDELGQIEPLARLLFIGLWTIADFKGEIEYRPARMKAQLLPYDNCDIEKLVTLLERSRFVIAYSVEGQKYLHICNFNKHQNPHPNERKKGSDIPKYESEVTQVTDSKGLVSSNDENVINNDLQHTNRADSLIPDPDSLISDSLKKPMSVSQAKTDELAEQVKGIFEYWKKTMGKDGKSKLTKKRESKIRARLKDGFSPREICEAIKGCAKSPHHMGQNDTGAIYDDLELICRDDSKIKMFQGIANKQDMQYSETTAKNIEVMRNVELE